MVRVSLVVKEEVLFIFFSVQLIFFVLVMIQFQKQLISTQSKRPIRVQNLVIKTASNLQEIVIPKSNPKYPSNNSFKT